MRTPLLLILAIGIMIMVISCQSENGQLFNRYYTSGSLLYRSHCENCHGVNGEGLGRLIPAFDDSLYLKKNISKLPCFVRDGLEGPITLSGKTFEAKMPAKHNLSAIEVAEILTYVTNSFGNKLGVIDASKVNADWAVCN